MTTKFLWIFDADAVWVLIPMVAALWALGGSGPKLVRRLGAPALVAAAAVSMGHGLIVSLACGLLLFTSACLPYGDWAKEKLGVLYPLWLFFVGSAWALALGPIAVVSGGLGNLAIMAFSSGLVFSALTLCSQLFNFPRWKFVEMISGAVIGGVAARVLVFVVLLIVIASGNAFPGMIRRAESDPQVGAVTNEKWCRGDGDSVECNQDAPGASAGGSTMQVQYNNGGSLGGMAGVNWDSATGTLVTESTVEVDLSGVNWVKVKQGSSCSGTTGLCADTDDNALYYNATAVGGVGGGDSISVGGSAATDANFIEGTGIDISLNTTPTPDEITVRQKWDWKPTIQSAKLPTSNPMAIDFGNNWPRGLFDADTAESATWSTFLYPFAGGTLNARLIFSMASASSNAVNWGIAIECKSDGDSEDVDTDGWGTQNNQTVTVAGTANYPTMANWSSLTGDSCAENDLLRIKLIRNAAASDDTATGDAEARAFVIYET